MPASHREKDEAYPVIAQISDRVRCISCADNLQWIIQVRHGDQWRGQSFCRTREVLIREARHHLSAELPAGALAILQRLPEMHR